MLDVINLLKDRKYRSFHFLGTDDLLMRVRLSNNAPSTGLRQVTSPFYENTAAVACPVMMAGEVVVGVVQPSDEQRDVTYIEVSFEDRPHNYLDVELCDITVE